MDCKLEFMVKYAANPKHYEALLIEEEQARKANWSNWQIVNSINYYAPTAEATGEQGGANSK